MGLYCSKQLETTFNQVGKKSLHIIFKASQLLLVTNVAAAIRNNWKCTQKLPHYSIIKATGRQP